MTVDEHAAARRRSERATLREVTTAPEPDPDMIPSITLALWWARKERDRG